MSEKNNEDKVTLDSQAFGEPKPDETIKLDEPKEEVPAEAPQAEREEEPEQTVPYSRMRTVIEARREAERKAREAEERLEELERERNSYRERTPEPSSYEDSIRRRAVAYFGDNKQAVEEYVRMESERLREIEDIAERRALDALQRRESQSRSELERNEQALDNELEDLSLTLGRPITQAEEDRILEIADEGSPVGDDGKYISGRPLPLNVAWRIYELEQKENAQSSKNARRQATAATSSRTETETVSREEEDKNYRPAWGNWRKKLNS